MRRPLALLAVVAATFTLAGSVGGADGFEVRKLAETSTTVTLGWDAQAGDGYRFYKDGVAVSRTFDPSRTSVRIGKAGSYRVEVLHVTAGVSGVYPPPPPPPPPPVANLYLSPSGDDSGPCSQAQPCRSFARAYAVASSGDVVLVGAGVYPSQCFAGGWPGGCGSSGPAGTKAVTFKGEPGNQVRQIHFHSPNLVFDGIHVDARGAVLGGSDGALFENGGEPFTFKNGSIGNVVDQKGAMIDGPGMVFDNVLFHDVVIRTAGVHSECIFASVPEGMIVRNSTFRNCAVMDIFFVWPDWWSPLPPAYGNVVLEGNDFGDPVGSCCGIYIGGTGPPPGAGKDRTMRGWVVRNNNFGDSPAVAGSVGSVFCGNTGAAPAAWKAACS